MWKNSGDTLLPMEMKVMYEVTVRSSVYCPGQLAMPSLLEDHPGFIKITYHCHWETSQVSYSDWQLK